MYSTCSELTPRAPIPDGRMEQIMQPCGNKALDPPPFKGDFPLIMVFIFIFHLYEEKKLKRALNSVLGQKV